MEYAKCYVFQPDDARPAKRQRTELQGLQASWRLRRKVYQQAWQSLKKRIDAKLSGLNATTISHVTAYLDAVADNPPAKKIPTGLILTGPSAALHSSLVRQASTGDGATSHSRIFVSLSSRSGSNLKSILKAINQLATSQTYDDDEDGEDDAVSSRRGTKLLNYDLQILHDYVQDHRIQQVIIAFEDTEAFDGNLLSEVIELLRSWLDRFSIVCLFNIATSVEFLQQRLSNAALKCLDGKLFDAAQSREEVDQVFDAVAAPENPLWIGPGLLSMMLERQNDFLQSIDSLIRGVQYVYSSAYYANALSLFLDPNLQFNDVPDDHFEALRNTDSFQQHLNHLVANGEFPLAKQLLTSNQSLFSLTQTSITEGHAALSRILSTISLIRSIQSLLPSTPISPKSTLYIQALSGNLLPSSSPLLKHLLLSIRKSPSNILLQILQSLPSLLPPSSPLSQAIVSTLASLSSLTASSSSSQSDPTQFPFRSEDDLKNSTLRTTIIAQKVSLSKQKSALSKQDEAYTSLLRNFSDALEGHFSSNLLDPKRDLLFHEIFLHDLKSPWREVFTPRPRHAVERALVGPHDYLDCGCCAPQGGKDGGEEEEEEGEGKERRAEDGGTLAGTQPASAVLYQLYLESGQLINARDLWEAFRAVMMGGEKGDEDGREEEGGEGEEKRIMALFQRGMAELKYLGMVKATRKRADHVAKVAWRGL